MGMDRHLSSIEWGQRVQMAVGLGYTPGGPNSRDVLASIPLTMIPDRVVVVAVFKGNIFEEPPGYKGTPSPSHPAISWHRVYLVEMTYQDTIPALRRKLLSLLPEKIPWNRETGTFERNYIYVYNQCLLASGSQLCFHAAYAYEAS